MWQTRHTSVNTDASSTVCRYSPCSDKLICRYRRPVTTTESRVADSLWITPRLKVPDQKGIKSTNLSRWTGGPTKDDRKTVGTACQIDNLRLRYR
jgi:hypothetical protein